jgi:hypothetical protein
MARGAERFTDITATVKDLSARMLAVRLRELEEAGRVDRVIVRLCPIRYQLTPRGWRPSDLAAADEAVLPALRDGGTFVSVRGWMGEPVRGIRYEAAAVSREFPHLQARLEDVGRPSKTAP